MLLPPGSRRSWTAADCLPTDMETSGYSARQRRAINQVWTACGDYKFEPQFLAMQSDGQPDLYMNCVIGLVHKWFGDELPKQLFAAWAGDARQAVYDDLAWLALENAVYEKELPKRPALAALRQAHASAFFESEYQLSRQEWMEKNQLVYAIQSARWKTVLGQRLPVLTPWEKGLSEALACPGTMSGEEVAAAIRTAFQKYLRFDGTAHAKTPLTLHFGERWAPLLTKLFTTEMVRTDDLAIGRSAAVGENGMVRASNALRSHLRSNERETEDRDYVERCFGRSLYAPKELALMEQRDCTGNHLGCHLWFTRGEPSPDKPVSADAQRLFQQAEEQAKRNRAAYVKNSDLYQSALLRLTEQIRNCMLIHQQPDTVSARQGHLDSRRVWRLPVLGDDKVFLRSDEESAPGFTVDLLLDGSASQNRQQEKLATQAYLIAESLSRCRIPVRVTAFCSVSGCTVLRVLRDYDHPEQNEGVFDYVAAGWNRDGLALRAMGWLLRQRRSEQSLLLVLSDASPNDDQRIPNGLGGWAYTGKRGVDDTAAEAAALRLRGVLPVCLFTGSDREVPDARRIYGQAMERLPAIGWLADAVTRLIRGQLRRG